MASKNTINKRVNIYINGREVTNDIKSIRAEMQKAVNQQAKMTIGSKEYIQKSKEIRQLKAIVQEHNRQLQTTQRKWFSINKIADGFNKYFGILTAFLASITGIVLGFKKLSEEVAKMDDIYSDVSKTTNLTRNEVLALNESFKKMDTRTSREELNRLAADAGKLGISGRQDILEFVDAGNQINVALGEDLGEGAIKNIGKISQVFKASTSELKNMGLKEQMLSIGSAINELGQSSTAREAYLVDFAKRLGGVAAQSGISIQNILGYASALDQSGQAVEMSATALQNFIMKLMANPAKFARLAGQEISSFTKLLQTDANQAIIQILSSLNQRGGFQALIPIFEEMGLDGARAVGVLSSLATNINLVTEAQKTANAGFASATSISDEYDKKNNNMQANLEKARKIFKESALTLAEKFAPALTMSTNVFTYFLKAIINAPAFYKQHSQLIWTLIAAFIALQRKTILSAASSLKDQAAHLLSAAAKKKNALATLYLNTYTEQYNKTQGRLHPVLLKARTAFTMLGRAMLANPIGTVIAAFTALKAAIDFYDKNNATSIHLEKEKKAIIDGLNQSVNTLSEKYKTYQTQISTLNRLSNTEKKALLEKLDLTIQNTEAELANYRAKKLRLQAENTRPKVWDMFINTLKSMGNVSKTMELNLKSAFENGKKSAEELDPILEKIEETLTGLKNQKTGLSDILGAETTADKIGTKTITELQEKVNLYRTALENTTLKTQDYERIQQKLTITQRQLNEAIKANGIQDLILAKKKELELAEQMPGRTREEIAARNQKIQAIQREIEELNKLGLIDLKKLAKEKLKAENDLTQKILEIRSKLEQNGMTETEKELYKSQQKYFELLKICKKYNLDETELYNVHMDELFAIIDKSLEDEVTASIKANEKIDNTLMSSSERQKAVIRQKYQELIALAEKEGRDTVALKQKMDSELEKVKNPGGMDLFGMTEEDWEDLQGKITMAIDMASQLSNIWEQFNQIQTNREKKELQDYEKSCNRKKELLNKQLNSGRISQEQYNARVSQLDADLEKKKTEIAKKQAKRDKATAITNAIINTASAIVRIWADVPKGDFGIATAILTALAAATGAAQIAVIASQPLPEYAEGGMTKGAKMYIAGEAGQEWIAPNNMLQDPITGPIINRLEMVRSGIMSPEQLILPDFQTMNSVPLYSTGGHTYTSNHTTPDNYYTSETTNIISDPHLESIDEKISRLIDYLSDPKNRQATISNDLLKRNEEELNTMNRLKRL